MVGVKKYKIHTGYSCIGFNSNASSKSERILLYVANALAPGATFVLDLNQSIKLETVAKPSLLPFHVG